MDHLADVDLFSIASAGSVLVGSNAPCNISVAEIGKQTITYTLTCDSTGRELWARIPNMKAWRFFDTRCLAATMLFAQKHLGMPVPEVLAWNNCPENVVGAPYIIMEKPSGVRLTDLDITERSDVEVLALFDDIARVHALASQPIPIKNMGCLDFAIDPSSHQDVDPTDATSYCTTPYLYCPSRPFHSVSATIPRADPCRSLIDFWKDTLFAEFAALYVFTSPTQNLKETMSRESISPLIYVEDSDGSQYKPHPQHLRWLGSLAYLMADRWDVPTDHAAKGHRNCLILNPSILSNIFVDPDTLRVTAVTASMTS